ncbi:hypothetical protein LTSESEN_1712, partial [Salmonella enterica subsp. enterica serovar Senftenberg str. A4-543]
MHTGNPGEFMYYPFVRKALFQLDPERGSAGAPESTD